MARGGPRWQGRSWQRGHWHCSVFMVGAAAQVLSWGACPGLGKQRVLGVASLLTGAHVKQDLGGRGGAGASLGDICSVLSWAVVYGLAPCQRPGRRTGWVMGLAKSGTAGEHQRVGVRFGPVCTGLQSKSLCRGGKENKIVLSVLNSREGKPVHLSLNKEQLIANISPCSEMKKVNYPDIRNRSLRGRSYFRRKELIHVPATLLCSPAF